MTYQVSGFGWRIDPFTGRGAPHEGIDFAAPIGTPILAAAGGIVITAEVHPQYGRMVEVDHGNGLVTRYAHASRLIAKVGELVKRGQKIAEVGSTGYSTGPHLHFELKIDGKGGVSQASMGEGTTLRDASFTSCELDAARALRFPETGGETTVRYPFTFAP